ncbi:DegV family protein [Alkalicoccus halolimnae]|uniref:DegV family protein n=1 Tax=Alkalicoccus halolimnae TaxID=1667239 RepID=A0A5C7FR30_9BACI|nr:DegV family protein [Alkalicoccus halolimnae]TXF87165.1 DegV family protein [Alkalicoccus halolimnae]
MKHIKVVTDSTVDLPKEDLDALGVTVVPLTVSVDGYSYEDGVDITSREFINKLVNSKEIPKSSQPSTGVFAELYEKLGADGSHVLSIHMASGLSGTYQSAVTAAGLTDVPVKVIDSQYISLALSFQVKEAAEMAENGSSMEEIISRLDDVRARTSLYIMVDTLEYLLKGGRIGRGRALVGSLLKIKPIASLDEGIYTPVTKARTHAQVIKLLTEKFHQNTEGKQVKGVGIAQAAAYDLAVSLEEKLQEYHNRHDFKIVDTTPIVSTHTGPGAMALMFYYDEN